MKPLEPNELKPGMEVVAIAGPYALVDEIKQVVDYNSIKDVIEFKCIGMFHIHKCKLYLNTKAFRTRLLLSDLDLYRRIYQ